MYSKGYKTNNGNYITKKEMQQRKNKYLNELKIARRQKEIDLEKENNLKIALHIQEKKEREALELENKKRNTQYDYFIEYASKNFNYNDYIIAYDIVTNSSHYIIANIKKNKITLDQVRNIYNIACNMVDDLIFSIESVTV